MIDDFTMKLILDLISGRFCIQDTVEKISAINKSELTIRGYRYESAKTDDPLALALIDYFATGNFASLAVVLDEEASRIDEEMNKPVTDDDLIKAGFFLDDAHGARKIARCKNPGFDLIDVGYKFSPEWRIPSSGILVTRRVLAALLSAKQ